MHKQLEEKLADFQSEERGKILQFYSLLLEENKVQNLTRLISPEDFWNGHMLDVLELLKINCLDYPAMDLGSGCGVPGLLAAIIQPQPWILVEAEKKKADFLERAVQALRLGDLVQVKPERGETFLKTNTVGSVVARAVGPIERIYEWFRKCSTWNNLILFKGPSWDEEWNKFQMSRHKQGLTLISSHSYTVGPEKKIRKIIKLAPGKR